MEGGEGKHFLKNSIVLRFVILEKEKTYSISFSSFKTCAVQKHGLDAFSKIKLKLTFLKSAGLSFKN